MPVEISEFGEDTYIQAVVERLKKRGIVTISLSDQDKNKLKTKTYDFVKIIKSKVSFDVFEIIDIERGIFESEQYYSEICFVADNNLDKITEILIDTSDIYSGYFITFYPEEICVISNNAENIKSFANFLLEHGRADLAIKIRGDIC